MADLIKPIFTRIDSSANWKTLNPVPRNGEQCIEVLESGLFKLKIGDGLTPWIALHYYTTDLSKQASINQTILNVTEKYPLPNGKFYDLESALGSLEYADINRGMIIMFQSSLDTWETWQFNGDRRYEYTNKEQWKRLSQVISTVIFNNNEEGDIENGGFVTDIFCNRSADELITISKTVKDVITGNNKTTNPIIIRSSDESIVGVWNEETNTLDLSVSQELLKNIKDAIDSKVDKTFADNIDGFVDGNTDISEFTIENGLLKVKKTRVNVRDGSLKTNDYNLLSKLKTIGINHQIEEDQTNINIDVRTENLIIDLGNF